MVAGRPGWQSDDQRETEEGYSLCERKAIRYQHLAKLDIHIALGTTLAMYVLPERRTMKGNLPYAYGSLEDTLLRSIADIIARNGRLAIEANQAKCR